MLTRSDSVPDAWANHTARGLLATLADGGVTMSLDRGRLIVAPWSQVPDRERAELAHHKLDLLVLVLACDVRTLDRLFDLRRAEQRGMPLTIPDAFTPGLCYTCSEPLLGRRWLVRCGWCAIAGRLYAGAPLTCDVLGAFDAALVGPHAGAT